MCIEYDGIQHFMPIKGWGGEENFEQIKERDRIKINIVKRKAFRYLEYPMLILII